MEKSILRKRFESFVWRFAMMSIAGIIDFTATNLGLFNLPSNWTVVLGLGLGELAKYFNTKSR